jgi:hypothetical protein
LKEYADTCVAVSLGVRGRLQEPPPTPGTPAAVVDAPVATCRGGEVECLGCHGSKHVHRRSPGAPGKGLRRSSARLLHMQANTKAKCSSYACPNGWKKIGANTSTDCAAAACGEADTATCCTEARLGLLARYGSSRSVRPIPFLELQVTHSHSAPGWGAAPQEHSGSACSPPLATFRRYGNMRCRSAEPCGGGRRRRMLNCQNCYGLCRCNLNMLE